MKGKLRHHLAYFWWAYAVSGLCVVLLWTSVFAGLARPKDFEQLQITCVGAFDHIGMQEALEEALPERTAQEIKRVAVENAVVSGPYDMDTLLRARLGGDCDLLIIECSVLEEYSVHLASYFKPLPDAALRAYFPEAAVFREDGENYGLLLSGETGLQKFRYGREDCCVFFSPHSVNLAGLYGGPEEQDAALQAIRYLMEAYNVQT